MDVFYAERRLQAFWSSDKEGMSRADHLLNALHNAGVHGLSPERYGVADLQRRFNAIKPVRYFDSAEGFDEAVTLDREMSAAFLLYADDLQSGTTNPETINTGVFVEQVRPDPLNLLRGVAAVNDTELALAELAPRDPRYRALQNALADLMSVAKSGGWGDPVPGGNRWRCWPRNPARVE